MVPIPNGVRTATLRISPLKNRHNITIANTETSFQPTPSGKLTTLKHPETTECCRVRLYNGSDTPALMVASNRTEREGRE